MYIPKPFDIASYNDALILKRYGFNFGTRLYYHTHYDSWEENEQSLEAVGTWTYSFYNEQNRYRVAAPYLWQLILWCMVHPIKGFRAVREMLMF